MPIIFRVNQHSKSAYHTELDKGTLTLLFAGKKQAASRGGPGTLKATPRCGGGSSIGKEIWVLLKSATK